VDEGGGKKRGKRKKGIIKNLYCIIWYKYSHIWLNLLKFDRHFLFSFSHSTVKKSNKTKVSKKVKSKVGKKEAEVQEPLDSDDNSQDRWVFTPSHG